MYACSLADCSFMARRLPLLLAAAGTGGSLGGLGFQVLSELLRVSRVEPVVPSPSTFHCPFPPDLEVPSSLFELPSSLDLPSLFAGVCLGLLLGPLLDLLFLLRHGWVRFVRVQARTVTRGSSLYRLLE